MAGALRRADLRLGLAGLIALSTLAYAWAGRRVPGLWIMPDEAIYADRGLRLWREGSLRPFSGQDGGYGLLYPLFAGLPLAVGGLASLKPLQSLVMSLTAVPVFFYGRRLMPPGHALVAAALTLASPLLLYSGLVMTEVLFYPLATLTLLAVARAVETGSARVQFAALGLIALAVATRAQAVVFVLILAVAALLDTVLGRDRGRLRSFWPTWAALAATALAVATAPALFGSYAGTLRGSYPVGNALGLAYDHLAYLVLTTAVLPFAALGLLLIDAVRGRERDRAARALVIVTACALVAVCVQVGFFSARFAPHLLGRNLASLPPLLFLVFALWLARGLPRPRWVVVPVCFAALAVLALAPWNKLVVAAALPDSLGSALVYRLSSSVDAASLVTLAGLALLVIFVVLPRRAGLVLPALILGLLAAVSVSASNLMVARAGADQQELLGSPRNWVDRAAKGDVTYLYDGELQWNSVWQQRFWNDRIKHVLSLPPFRVPGPMPQQAHAPTPDGRLAIRDRYVIAGDRFAFVGTPIAHHTRGADLEGLTLWHLTGKPTLSTITTGFLPNGDMIVPGKITVYGCAGGRLQLTLLPKATRIVLVLLDGIPVLRRRIAGLDSWYGSIAVPRSHRGVCRFTIRGGLLLGSTVRSFERR